MHSRIIHRLKVPERIGPVFVVAILGGLAFSNAAPICTLIKGQRFYVGEVATVQATCTGASSTASYTWQIRGGREGSIDFSLGPYNTPKFTHTFAEGDRYDLRLLVEEASESFPFLSQCIVVPRPTATPPGHHLSLAFDSVSSRLYTVNRDQGTLSSFSSKLGNKIWEAPSGKGPRSIALDSNGQPWVVNQDDATITLHRKEDGSLLEKISLPRASRPVALVFHPQYRYAYVTLEALGKLARIDVGLRKVDLVLSVVPMAHALAISHDGLRGFVTRRLSPATHAEIAEVDLAAFTLKATHPIAIDKEAIDGEASARGIANELVSVIFSPDGKTLLVAGSKSNVIAGQARDGMPLTFQTTVRTEILEFALTPESLSPWLNPTRMRRLDLDNRNLPSSLAFSPQGEYLLISLLGSNEIEVRDRFSHRAITFLPGARNSEEWAPDGILALPGNRLAIHYFLSRQLAIRDLSDLGSNNLMPRLSMTTTIASEALDPLVLRGKRMFHNSGDPRMAADGYLSCATCHFDGGSDGRVWDFTQRGEGLRRTTNLRGKGGLRQGPVHWTANFDEIQDFENDIRNNFSGTGFLSDADFATTSDPLGKRKAGLSSDLDALAIYVASLVRAQPSPFRNSDGSFTADALAGKVLFESDKIGCAQCHGGSQFTDSGLRPDAATLAGYAPYDSKTTPEQGSILHDVGTLKTTSGQRRDKTLTGLDTPSLLGLWDGGPYLHDGSAETLSDVLVFAEKAQIEKGRPVHGNVSGLSKTEKDQLIAYLLQLDGSELPDTKLLMNRKNFHGKIDRHTHLSRSREWRSRDDGAFFNTLGRVLKFTE